MRTVTKIILLGSSSIRATGGTVTDINVSGRLWRVHTFTSGGDFIVSQAFSNSTAQYLIVAGGGAGGGVPSGPDASGGGGGGGVLSGVLLLTPQTYPVVVGLGGVGGLNRGGSGQNSSFGGFTAIGGGGGGAQGAGQGSGASGGSGGGGWFNSAGGAGTPGQGSNGEANYGSGGGASGTGVNGILSDISGSPLYYGGGGFKINASFTAGFGVTPSDVTQDSGLAQHGAANTGAGGGAIWRSVATVGRNGGSGIVIIRYPLIGA